MLTYDFNKTNKALYIQLYENIKKDILSRKIMQNEKLPSKRKLANHLGLALITIENAYEQLIAEGYIYSIEKKGYYVSSLSDKNFSLHNQVNNNQKKEKQTKPLSYYDLKSADVDINLFPFSTWSKLMRQIISEKNKNLLVKTDSFGIKDLQIAISNHLYSYHRIEIDPNQIIIGAGSEYLYSMIIKLLGFNKVFALENPGYDKISKVYQSNNVITKYIDLDENGIDINQLNDADVVHVSPAHQFPTGVVMPIKRKLELLKWANEKEGRIIIEDDYDSEFRFKGVILPSIKSIDKNDNVIYINTFSKTIAPSMRISYMIIPQKYTKIYKEKLGFYSCTVPNFEQYTLARFIEEGYFERHLNKMKNYYRKKKELFISMIKQSKLTTISTIIYKDSGLHFLLEIKTNINDNLLIKKAFEKGVKINSLSQYYLNNSQTNNHVFIINFSQISQEDFQKVITIFEQILF